MNIYLACTVRGDRRGLNAARAIAELLARIGHSVLTPHLLADDVDAAEAVLSEGDVFVRDMHWLTIADLLIAEASGSSYGVGYEVGYVLGGAEQTGQRVLVVFDAALRPGLSRLITGNSHAACTTYGYADTTDLLRFVERALSDVELRDVNLPC